VIARQVTPGGSNNGQSISYLITWQDSDAAGKNVGGTYDYNYFDTDGVYTGSNATGAYGFFSNDGDVDAASGGHNINMATGAAS
jgi:hypothetical protein